MTDRPHDDLDNELTDEQSAARDDFRRFAQAEVAPGAQARDRDESTPGELIQRVAEQGYLGAVVPTEYSGGAQDSITFGVLNAELGRACSSIRSLLTVHSMVCLAIHKCGDDEQRARWLPRLSTGEVIGAFALSEPKIGSDAYHVETTAVAENDGYLINGKKKWTTFGQVADLFLVFAQLGDKPTAFLVERDTPGFSVEPIRGMLGTRASMLAELTLQDCAVGKDALLGRLGFGMHAVAATALDLGRYSVAWGCLGVAQDCLHASVRHIRRRKQFGKRLYSFQLIKRMIASMAADVSAAMLQCLYAGRLRDEGDPNSIIQTCMAKYTASTACSRVADDAVQLHGAIGCSEESSVERHFRDAKVFEIIEGSTQMQELMLADHVTSSLPR